MTILRINQVESGLDKLLVQFKGKYNIESTLTSYLSQAQDLQTTYEEMLDERSLTTAVGDQLDMIGAIVGEERNLRDDEEYRTAIFIRIAINIGDGTLPTVVDIVKLLVDTDKVEVFEHYPASLYMYITTSEQPDKAVVEAVNKILPAGVSLGYIGFGDNPLVFTPYDQEYAEVNLVTHEGEPVVDYNEEPIVVTVKAETILAEKAWLAESATFTNFNLVDEVGDNIVDEVGDRIVLYSEGDLPPQTHGIPAETI